VGPEQTAPADSYCILRAVPSSVPPPGQFSPVILPVQPAIQPVQPRRVRPPGHRSVKREVPAVPGHRGVRKWKVGDGGPPPRGTKKEAFATFGTFGADRYDPVALWPWASATVTCAPLSDQMDVPAPPVSWGQVIEVATLRDSRRGGRAFLRSAGRRQETPRLLEAGRSQVSSTHEALGIFQRWSASSTRAGVTAMN
jgi:hypothetical protein